MEQARPDGVGDDSVSPRRSVHCCCSFSGRFAELRATAIGILYCTEKLPRIMVAFSTVDVGDDDDGGVVVVMVG